MSVQDIGPPNARDISTGLWQGILDELEQHQDAWRDFAKDAIHATSQATLELQGALKKDADEDARKKEFLEAIGLLAMAALTGPFSDLAKEGLTLAASKKAPAVTKLAFEMRANLIVDVIPGEAKIIAKDMNHTPETSQALTALKSVSTMHGLGQTYRNSIAEQLDSPIKYAKNELKRFHGGDYNAWADKMAKDYGRDSEAIRAAITPKVRDWYLKERSKSRLWKNLPTPFREDPDLPKRIEVWLWAGYILTAKPKQYYRRPGAHKWHSYPQYDPLYQMGSDEVGSVPELGRHAWDRFAAVNGFNSHILKSFGSKVDTWGEGLAIQGHSKRMLEDYSKRIVKLRPTDPLL